MAAGYRHLITPAQTAFGEAYCGYIGRYAVGRNAFAAPQGLAQCPDCVRLAQEAVNEAYSL